MADTVGASGDAQELTMVATVCVLRRRLTCGDVTPAVKKMRDRKRAENGPR